MHKQPIFWLQGSYNLEYVRSENEFHLEVHVVVEVTMMEILKLVVLLVQSMWILSRLSRFNFDTYIILSLVNWYILIENCEGVRFLIFVFKCWRREEALAY
jgi:hypothetical protein